MIRAKFEYKFSHEKWKNLIIDLSFYNDFASSLASTSFKVPSPVNA